MSETQEFSAEVLISRVASDMARVIAGRPQDPATRRDVPAPLVMAMISALSPGDFPQAMLAAQVIMLQEMLKDCIAPSSVEATAESARAARKEVLAMNRALNMNLTRLDKYKAKARAEAVKAEKEAAKQPEQTAAPEAEPKVPTHAPRNDIPHSPPQQFDEARMAQNEIWRQQFLTETHRLMPSG